MRVRLNDKLFDFSADEDLDFVLMDEGDRCVWVNDETEILCAMKEFDAVDDFESLAVED